MSIKEKIDALRKTCTEVGIDGFLVNDEINLFYFMGYHFSAGMLYVDLDNAYLVLDNRYYDMCGELPGITLLRAEEDPLKARIRGKVGFDSTYVYYQTVQDWSTHYSQAELIPHPLVLQKIRAIKTVDEIAALKHAAYQNRRGMDFARTLIQENPSYTERQISDYLEIYWKQEGSSGLSFNPIIAAGVHSAIPHYRAGNTRLVGSGHVLIDIGVNFNDYHSDMTRIVYLHGEKQAKIEEIEKIVMEAYQRSLELCKPGTLVGELDSAARGIISSYGFGDHFKHSLGHGIGLEVHEYPILRNRPPYKDCVLAAGMVITIEPGIYLPGIGGVRYENTILIHEQGCEEL